MEHELSGRAAGLLDPRREARRAADKIAKLYLTRDQLRASREDWLASGLDFALAHPLVAIAAAFAAGCMVGAISRRRH
jgi:hypothetical protein